MAESLIEQLQLEACDKATPTADLLRKALLVASKLEVPVVPQWIRQELSGYKNADVIPPYRYIRGTVRALNPVRGWIPVQFPTDKLEQTISTRVVTDSLPAIEAMLANDSALRSAYPAEQQVALQQMFDQRMQFACDFPRASFLSVIEEVRTKILEWSMELEKAGIKGHGVTFTKEEKNKAQAIVINSATVNIGTLGNVNATNVAAGLGARAGSFNLSEIKALVEEIRRHISETTMSSADANKLRNALQELTIADGAEQVEPGKAERLLKIVLSLAGEIKDQIVSAGIRAVVETWMRAHGFST